MAAEREHRQGRFRVVIAGAGVAALETMLALEHLAPDRFAIELVAPTKRYVYRPLAVGEPFGLGHAHRLDLGKLVRYRGATHRQDSVAEVRSDQRRVVTAGGAALDYDWLVLAIGASARQGLSGALTFDGAAGVDQFRALLEDLAAGRARRVVFAVPPDGGWPLPLYELALLTASFLFERRIAGAELAIVTPEPTPLALFGARASRAVGRLLDESGIECRTATTAGWALPGELRLDTGEVIVADRVVTLPRLEPLAPSGVPRDERGFIPTDRHGRVTEVDRVYAAGDVTSGNVKQGGLAAQQADAVAEAIAAASGVALRPTPYRPVLRGLLMTGQRPRYLRADRTHDHRDTSAATNHALWWPPGKIAGKFLTPYLAARTGTGLPPTPGRDSLSVNVDLPSGEGL